MSDKSFSSRLKNAWNAFFSRDPTTEFMIPEIATGYSSSYRPDRKRFYGGAERSIISSIYKNNQTKLQSLNNFYNFYISSLQKFFKPIKNYKPFVVYCDLIGPLNSYTFAIS